MAEVLEYGREIASAEKKKLMALTQLFYDVMVHCKEDLIIDIDRVAEE